MTQEIGELLICEYSAKQRCFHIETLAEALQKNRRGIIGGQGLDYIPFAVTDEFDEANKLCEEMRKRIHGR